MLYSVCCSARRRKERLPLSATSSSSQPTTHLPPAPPVSVSGVCHACPERLGDLVGALDPIFLSPVRPPHSPPNSHGIISFADPHPLNPVVSIFYKNIGGQGGMVNQLSIVGDVQTLKRSNVQTFQRVSELSPLCSSSYALFSATGFPQLFWNQFLAHSFHRDGGVPPSRSLSPSIGPLSLCPPNSFRMRSSKNLSSLLSLTPLQSISISPGIAAKSFGMRSSTHFSPNSFRMRSSKKSGGRGLRVNWAATSTRRPKHIARKNQIVSNRGCNSLPSSFEHDAVFDALHKLHLDFGLLVGHAFGGFRRHDQRLWAIGQIKRALELQRLDAALLAGILLQRGLEHLRLGVQLVGDIRRQHRHHHRHRGLDLDADLCAVMVRREPAVHFQEGRQLILLFDLPGPPKLRLDAIFHTQPAEVLDVHVVGRLELPLGRFPLRQYRRDSRDSRAHCALDPIIRVQDRAESGKHRVIGTIALVANDERHRHRRDETRISGLHHMFSGAQLLQVVQALGMLHRPVPLFGARQEYRDRQLRFDVHLHIAAVSARVIRLPSVIVSGVQPHILLIAGQPVENSFLAKRRPGQRTHQQKREEERHFDVSHSAIIFGAAPPHPQASRANLSPGSILINGTGTPTLRFDAPKNAPLARTFRASNFIFLISSLWFRPRSFPCPTLPSHADLRRIRLIALILHGLQRRRAQRLLVRILRQIAIAPNHLFTVHNAHQPLGLARVPGNFHLIRTHSHLLLRFLRASFLYIHFVPSASAAYPYSRSRCSAKALLESFT